MAQANEVAIPPSVQGVHARLQLIEANQQLRLQVEASFIVTVHALLVALVDTIIPSRYSGRGGRYKSADTARKTYVRAIALAALRYGKFPSADDWRLLFMYPPPQKNSIDGRALSAWAKKIHPDPRATVSNTAGSTQTTMLDYASRKPQDYRAAAVSLLTAYNEITSRYASHRLYI